MSVLGSWAWADWKDNAFSSQQNEMDDATVLLEPLSSLQTLNQIGGVGGRKVQPGDAYN